MSGLYIHIPFCRSKCAYCDFYSGPMGAELRGQYVRALLREWQMRREGFLSTSSPVSTVYLGGGTPSLLPPALLRQLLEGLHIDFSEIREATIEANPEDISPAWLDEVKALGINRVSIGIQSFSAQTLLTLGRTHGAEASLKALDILAADGINYSADLIYAVPGQTLQEWQCDLDTLLAYRPPHFSAYLLSFEPGTRLTARLRAGRLAQPDDDTAREMYDCLCHRAAALGYDHYEISNFGLPSRHSLHNSSYWDFTPYIGLGCAAHSFSGTSRSFNPPSLRDYLAALACDSLPLVADPETSTDALNDYIITSLRTSAGLSLSLVADRFGHASADQIRRLSAPLLAEGLLRPTPAGFRITEEDFIISDALLRDLLL